MFHVKQYNDELLEEGWINAWRFKMIDEANHRVKNANCFTCVKLNNCRFYKEFEDSKRFRLTSLYCVDYIKGIKTEYKEVENETWKETPLFPESP